MPSFRETAVDDPVARRLLAEYFAMRADTFPPELGAYAPSFPATADFEPPNGVFLVVLSDDGSGGKEDGRAEVGCGGVRRLTPARFEIKHLWIRPAARGKGFGRLLLRELERRAGSSARPRSCSTPTRA
ncbi:MAG: GNAT family N-acetyltransferase, partial [Galbitalea sp.]